MAKAKSGFPWHDVFEAAFWIAIVFLGMKLLPTLISGVSGALNTVKTAAAAATGSATSIPTVSTASTGTSAAVSTSGMGTTSSTQGSSSTQFHPINWKGEVSVGGQLDTVQPQKCLTCSSGLSYNPSGSLSSVYPLAN